jgi:hypothetical protein
MITKVADSKGRVALGSDFAGRMLIIDDSDPARLILTPAVAIPEREAWLYKNPEALAAVRQGLEEARAGKFAAAPDTNADASLAAELAG